MSATAAAAAAAATAAAADAADAAAAAAAAGTRDFFGFLRMAGLEGCHDLLYGGRGEAEAFGRCGGFFLPRLLLGHKEGSSDIVRCCSCGGRYVEYSFRAGEGERRRL